MKGRAVFVAMLLLASGIGMMLSVPEEAEASQPIGVAGYLYDEDGNIVPNTEVNVTNINTNVTETTTSDGDGLYTVSIEADDGDILQGNFTYDNKTGYANRQADLNLTTNWLNISIGSDKPPHCRFTYSPKEPQTSSVISFNDQSYDPDGQVVYWKWDFGDNSISIEQNPSHRYSENGTYKVRLMVKDNDGYWDSCYKYIDVEDQGIVIPPIPPPIHPHNPYTVPEMYHMLKVDEVGNGDDVKVAVIDTGINHRTYDGHNMHLIEMLNHPSLINGRDNNGHGTWTNYAMFYGIDSYTSGKQYSLKVIGNEGCSAEVLLDAMDRCIDLDVDVVSISLGGSKQLHGVMDKKVDKLRRNGIIVVCAGGNNGPYPSTIMTPASSDSALAIGSVDPKRSLRDYSDDQISPWSSRGPVKPVDEAKPDMVAGGESIIGPWLMQEKVVSGTSMATPCVAGGCAVVYADHDNLFEFLETEYMVLSFGNALGGKGIVPFTFEFSLEHTSHEMGDKNIYGHGVPDFKEMEGMAVFLAFLFIFLPLIIIAVALIVGYLLYRRRKKKKGKKSKKSKKKTREPKRGNRRKPVKVIESF